uniref:C2H2-type domain-containing protein n=1 Tax=Gasterosteus aculeatus aculeatus TaxID=481459 RepID=A0AAQ4P8A6_GASAC|nr:flocculation protein FLO11-like isoform X1 [Gasterosteus aculeatus aculeatus]
MSADEFQTKYSSVMEVMLKGAIAETTKLFETMVDELKAEISRVKKENDDLKTRCGQFENARNQPSVRTREADPVQGPSEGSAKRDRAIQCDLLPVRTMLVEQCQPLRPSSRQNHEQQCTYEKMEYSLQDHTYGVGTTQMAFIFVKQESYDSSQLVLKQEETEAPVSGLDLSDKSGSPQASVFAAENEGILEPYLGRERDLQGAQKQSSELGNSLVLSFAETKDNLEDSEFIQMDRLITTEKHPLVVAHQQSEVATLEKEQPSGKSQQSDREGKVSVGEPAGVSQQHCVGGKSTEEQLSLPTSLNTGETCEQLKSGVAQIGGGLKLEWAQHRRGRPSKKAKLMQHPVKEIGNSLTVSETTLSKICFSEKEKPSESQHNSMASEEGAIKPPFNEVLSANETLNLSNIQPPERCTSVTLQDAILLVEAMNQSTEKDTLTTIIQTAAPPQTQFALYACALETVDEIPAEKTQLVKNKIGVAPVASHATNEAQCHINVVTAKESHTVTPSNTTTPSTTAVKRSVPSPQQHLPCPPVTFLVPSNHDQVVSYKIVSQPGSVSSLICHKIEALLPPQLPSVVSVVAAQKSAALPRFTAETSSISSDPQKSTQITSRKLFPPVLSQSTTTSTDLQSGTTARPKIRIVGQKPVSKTIVQTSKQDSTKSDAFMVSSPQFIPSSKDISIFVDTQTILDKVSAISSKKKYQTLRNLEIPKQTAPVSELVNAVTQTCSSSNLSDKLKPTPVSVENNLTAVVRLTRLPFPISANEAVLVSRLHIDGSSGSQSVLKEKTQGEHSPPPSQTHGLSANDCTNLKETSVAIIANTSQMSKEPDEIQETASLSFENCTFLDEDPADSRLSTTIKTEQSAENCTAVESASYSNWEMISIAMQDRASSNGPRMAEKGSVAVVHLTPITSKNISDLHLKMTKAQFLTQLAVTPAPEDPKKVSSNDSVKAAAAETSPIKKKELQKKSLVARLQSHLKTCLQTRRTKTNSEPCTATKTCTVSPKRCVIENGNPKSKDGKRDPFPICPKDSGAVEDTIPKKIRLTPVNLRRSGACEAGIGTKKTVAEPSLISSTTFKATRKSAAVTPRRSSSGTHSVRLTPRKSTSVSRRESTATEKSASPKKSKPTSVNPRRSSSIKERESPKKTKSISVSPRRSSSINKMESPKKTKSTLSSKNIKNISASPRWIHSTTDCARPKSTGPKRSIDESTTFCRRRCTLPKDGSSSKPNNRESISFSPSYSITPDRSSNKDTKSVTGSSSVRWPKSVKNGVSPRNTRETATAKKPRLLLDGSGPKQKLMFDAEELANVAKPKTVANLKNCSQSKLLNGSKTGQLAESRASCETGRKCTAKVVWIHPRPSVSKTPLVGVNKEPSSPRLQSHMLVYPPSVSLLPIPVRGPPIVSPLQPLSVIGRRLLKNQCGECGRVLSSAAALESHVSLHAGRRPFSCTLCGKRFPDSGGLKRHSRVHRNGRIHICHQCGKGFVYSFGLTKHLHMVHRKIKPFICQICNKGFFAKRDVEAHIRIHTGRETIPLHPL